MSQVRTISVVASHVQCRSNSARSARTRRDASHASASASSCTRQYAKMPYASRQFVSPALPPSLCLFALTSLFQADTRSARLFLHVSFFFPLLQQEVLGFMGVRWGRAALAGRVGEAAGRARQRGSSCVVPVRERTPQQRVQWCSRASAAAKFHGLQVVCRGTAFRAMVVPVARACALGKMLPRRAARVPPPGEVRGDSPPAKRVDARRRPSPDVGVCATARAEGSPASFSVRARVPRRDARSWASRHAPMPASVAMRAASPDAVAFSPAFAFARHKEAAQARVRVARRV